MLSALTLKPAGVLQDEALGTRCVGDCRGVHRGWSCGGGEAGRRDRQADAGELSKGRAGLHQLFAGAPDGGRQTEINARNDVIAWPGEKCGIAMLGNEMAAALMKSM